MKCYKLASFQTADAPAGGATDYWAAAVLDRAHHALVGLDRSDISVREAISSGFRGR
jgi:hypothetical protein